MGRGEVVAAAAAAGGRADTTTRAWHVDRLRLTGSSVASECGGDGDLLPGLSSMAGPLSSAAPPISPALCPHPRHSHSRGGWG